MSSFLVSRKEDGDDHFEAVTTIDLQRRPGLGPHRYQSCPDLTELSYAVFGDLLDIHLTRVDEINMTFDVDNRPPDEHRYQLSRWLC